MIARPASKIARPLAGAYPLSCMRNGKPPRNKRSAQAASPDTSPSAERFLNRELSLLSFDRRVLEEAQDPRHPLLERLKFLAIVATNLDEFGMIRVAGLHDQVAAGVIRPSPDGRSPQQQLDAISEEVKRQLAAQQQLLRALLPLLQAQGIELVSYQELDPDERTAMDGFFSREIFPVLTPLATDPSHPFPHISNRSLNLAVAIRDAEGEERFARVKVPEVLPRLLPVSPPPRTGAAPSRRRFVWIEDVIASNIQALFPGMPVTEAHPFRVIRDADMELQEDEAEDLLRTIEQSVRRRRFGAVVWCQVASVMPERLRQLLAENMEVDAVDVLSLDGRLGLEALHEIAALDRHDLRDSSFIPALPPALSAGEGIFTVIRRHDVLLHHPYDSFEPVVQLLREAAADKDVVAIKQTLYRVGKNSPVVEALLAARARGKQVTVLVELKARFDEENNIEWARALEKDGVHVVYGLLGLKTHCKLLLVVRREPEGLRRYVHVGTGNYNPLTASVYTDLGLLTCNPEVGADASDLFNLLTGYSAQKSWRQLLVAPLALRERLAAMIDREIAHVRAGRGGQLCFKVNAVVDPSIILKLYEASAAGVQVELVVRGVCCLRPGVPGLSERIRVVSILGRFLEHSRLFWFGNGGQPEVYLGSADLMQRNLDRRVEVLCPILDPAMRALVKAEVLDTALRDTAGARVLAGDGSYVRVKPAGTEPAFDSQGFLIEKHQRQALLPGRELAAGPLPRG